MIRFQLPDLREITCATFDLGALFSVSAAGLSLSRQAAWA